MRVTNAVARKARHKKILSLAKGYKWGRKNLYRLALNAVTKAGQNSYRDRKRKKRDFRRLWIIRIAAFLRNQGKRYSEFMYNMTKAKIIINRKMLAEMAVKYPDQLNSIINKAYSV